MISVRIFVVLAVIALAAAAGFLYSGAYNVAADEPHWPVTHGLLETLKERSIAARIATIKVPADLDGAERLRRGAGNYDAMCVGCHLRPGVHNSEIRKGLYPQPPDLAQAIPGREPSSVLTERAAARQFWIIKHGVKASGMPAWSKGGMDDETIWDMVALLRKLPALDGTEYVALVASSEGHAHAGSADHHSDAETQEAPSTQHKHEDGHEHAH